MRLKELIRRRVKFRGVRGTVTAVFTEGIFDILEKLFIIYTEKYPEEEFKKKVDENFNLVKDLIENHRNELVQAMAIFSKLKRYIVWDRSTIVETVVEALERKGWKLRDKDKQWIYKQVVGLEKLLL